MPDAAFTPEESLILRVCRPGPDADRAAEVEKMLSAPLDWNRIVPLVAKHKVLPLFWDTLSRLDLIRAAMRTGGLSKLWAHYLSQLYVANRERTQLFLDMLETQADEWRTAGLELVVLKGGALIGSLYQPANRMLHDIDLAMDRAIAPQVRQHFFAAGYRHGVLDVASGLLEPLGRKAERMWLFYNHTLPPFYKATGSVLTPYHKVQVGFDFFDTEDEYAFGLAAVAAEALDKPGSRLRVPRPEHMLLNLCTHIYREGISLVYADVNDNWQLIKFCDLLGYLHLAGAELDRERFAATVQEAGLAPVCAFAFHYTARVFPDEVLAEWCTRYPMPVEAMTPHLREGSREVPGEDTFERQLFSLRAHRPARSRWNQKLGQEEW
ncbi:hypothetical protein GCM10009828_093440 [Actinoplanes couchii]|uniref:Nucleotidyltransferase family protein n=2 Tax=Actinoplanes couchii TaxID=403638 RepID=A0ABQ3XSD0_9ACTN|nr:hypothetical protein Aco03nite_098200 [Actinoplanes couchii]